MSTKNDKDIPIFLHKLHNLIDHGTNDKEPRLVEWSKDGKSFEIMNPKRFAKEILPSYFKSSNFNSFVRQLNFYGFRKINPEEEKKKLSATTCRNIGNMRNSNTSSSSPLLYSSYNTCNVSKNNILNNSPRNTSKLWKFHHPSFIRNRTDLMIHIRRRTYAENGVATREELELLRMEFEHKAEPLIASQTIRMDQLEEMCLNMSAELTGLRRHFIGNRSSVFDTPMMSSLNSNNLFNTNTNYEDDLYLMDKEEIDIMTKLGTDTSYLRTSNRSFSNLDSNSNKIESSLCWTFEKDAEEDLIFEDVSESDIVSTRSLSSDKQRGIVDFNLMSNFEENEEVVGYLLRNRSHSLEMKDDHSSESSGLATSVSCNTSTTSFGMLGSASHIDHPITYEEGCIDKSEPVLLLKSVINGMKNKEGRINELFSLLTATLDGMFPLPTSCNNENENSINTRNTTSCSIANIIANTDTTKNECIDRIDNSCDIEDLLSESTTILSPIQLNILKRVFKLKPHIQMALLSIVIASIQAIGNTLE